jgi:hypothetical protein
MGGGFALGCPDFADEGAEGSHGAELHCVAVSNEELRASSSHSWE